MTCFIHKLPASAAPWAYAIEFDFNQAMVDGIKERVPSRARKWSPEDRKWYFKDDVIDIVAFLAVAHCGRYVHVESLEEDAPVEAYAALHLLPSAPGDLVKAAYRIMSKLHHPDTGGTTREMQRVNEAYRRLTMATRSQNQ
jgi:hypothetical protein